MVLLNSKDVMDTDIILDKPFLAEEEKKKIPIYLCERIAKLQKRGRDMIEAEQVELDKNWKSKNAIENNFLSALCWNKRGVFVLLM